MTHLTFGHNLPRPLSAALFGDRARHGSVAQKDDPHWLEWQQVCVQFYQQTQRRSFGHLVNRAGYRIMRQVDLAGAHVLEIGPGDLDHVDQWRGRRPRSVVLADVRQSMLELASDRLRRNGVTHTTCLLPQDASSILPFDDDAFDVIVSFYSLEHLYPLHDHLKEMLRVLKPGGLLAGAIPTEGGLAWGMGRLLTTRRWASRHTTLDYNKIICWEHPNFADHVLTELDQAMRRRRIRYWPLRVPSIDLNLVVSFIYAKR